MGFELKDTHLGWRLYPVLGCHFRVNEPVVFVAHVVLEGGGSIGQVIWLLDISKEGLL